VNSVIAIGGGSISLRLKQRCFEDGVVGRNFAQPLNGSLFHRVTREDFLCGFNLCARQTVKVKNYRGALSRIFERGSRAGLFFF
jgi:hypothetical protein